MRAVLFARGDWLSYAFLTPAIFVISRRWPQDTRRSQAVDGLQGMGGVVAMIAVALLAAYVPARCAARVQPVEALRHS